MPIKAGERIVFRLMSDPALHYATVVSIDDVDIVLKPEDDIPADILPGQYLSISEPATDIEYYGEVVVAEGSTLLLRRMWMGKRGFFRVDDVFPMTWRVVNDDFLLQDSKIFSGYGIDAADLEVPAEDINPRLWKMLVDINAKLDLVLKLVHLESEGLAKSQSIAVNISASGIRFGLDNRLSIDDMLELKMLLPAYPPVGIQVNGRVVRVEDNEQGGCEVSLHFVGLTDEVQEVIIQYALKRQRELMRRQRRQE